MTSPPPATPPATTGEVTVSSFDVVSSVIGMAGLALGGPLLEILGRNPPFFVAHRIDGAALIALAVALLLVLPGVVGGAVAALRPRRVRRYVHAAVIGALSVIFAAGAIERIGGLPLYAVVVAALVAGLLAGIGTLRASWFRQLLGVGFVVPVIALVWFLAWSPASALVTTGHDGHEFAASPARPRDIVLVVFDELPSASLTLDGRRIDAERYPNLAALAEDGLWAPDVRATAVQTVSAVPPIFSGQLPSGDALPIADDHPGNLFTLLDPDYHINAIEPVTALCPDPCDETDVERGSWRSVASDLVVLTGHVALPQRLADRWLPEIEDRWSGFAEQPRDTDDLRELATAPLRDDRSEDVERFIRGIREEQQQPVLHALHAMIPHRPWEFLPDGSRYVNGAGYLPSGGRRGWWGEDEELLRQAYQRHLLQVGYVDTVVGRVTSELRRTGRYDDSVVVVTADHGIAFRPGASKRSIDPRAPAEIVAVPLIIAGPGIEPGTVLEGPAELIDVVPTIADVLDVELAWEVDGASLLGDDHAPPQRGRVLGADGLWQHFDLEDGDPAQVPRPSERLGEAIAGPYGLFAIGPHGDLVGRDVGDLSRGDWEGVAVEGLGPPGLLGEGRLGPGEVPALVTGSLRGAEPELPVAVVVNGRIGGVTRTYDADGEVQFGALVPPDLLTSGANEVSIALVEDTGGEVRLRVVPGVAASAQARSR